MLTLTRLLGMLLGRLGYVLGIRREVTLQNLRLAFPEWPERNVRRTARKSFANLGIVFAEMAYLRFASRRSIGIGIQITNIEAVRPLLSGGAILLSGHLGNWEWLALGCALAIDRPLNVVIKNQRSSFAEQFLIRMRTRFGNKMLNAGDARRVFRALASGELLAILGDQTAGVEDLRVPFFGYDVPTFEGTARLALQ